ncbi:DUF3489 domain-containing protein [Shimia sp. R9_3]|uniref:DUF3489 domain-containing protein n=1 Tax=Shimia sp. R9_3 TaxID=2821113 RepID=UPI001ADD2435|nr:DUF3489 domain-containing protein [Shimia sp. R9_3]MBO9400928.1 DUF3489 domain-containing protein [Shimia sp. R9_3]
MTKPKQIKRDKARAILNRKLGKTSPAICKATDWHPHTTRAVLSGFGLTDYRIERPPFGNGGPSVYRITAAPEVRV